MYSLPDGRQVWLRPVSPEDQPAIAEAIKTASRRTLLHRFFIPLRGLAPGELRRMLVLNPDREYCLVGELSEAGGSRLIGGARYVRTAVPGQAEMAMTVHDEFQRQGLGRAMLKALVQKARGDGVTSFVADILAENVAMLGLMAQCAPRRKSSLRLGVCRMEFDLAEVAA